jgi:formamidopyrimidine-DNA glycosylase
MGNIYCDEALHAAGIHPLNRADTLSATQVRRLHGAIKATLRKAIRYNGTTFLDYRTSNGQPGGFGDQLQVYGRAGAPCHSCHRTLVRLIVSGRSSVVCPTCQPPP